jgi:hypothetical protein
MTIPPLPSSPDSSYPSPFTLSLFPVHPGSSTHVHCISTLWQPKRTGSEALAWDASPTNGASGPRSGYRPATPQDRGLIGRWPFSDSSLLQLLASSGPGTAARLRRDGRWAPVSRAPGRAQERSVTETVQHNIPDLKRGGYSR